MKTIEELEKKIKLSESRIELARKQLQDNESGENKLSIMVLASTELCIERNRFLLNKYKQKLRRFQLQDISLLEENERTKEFIRQKNYFKYQIQRIKHTKSKTETEISDAICILQDISHEIQLDDDTVFDIAHKSKELHLEIHSELDDELIEIKNEFLGLVEGNFNDVNNELKLLNYRIPIIILQLRILLKNIQENIDESTLNKKSFSGLPKFEDWWIHELWVSHQAYMGLFKWKDIVLGLCISTEQKRAFEIIFKNWILVKKLLNVKGGFAYFYNYAFDEMIYKYAGLEDEHDESNLNSMKAIVQTLTKKEKFNSVSDDHNIITPYMQFKIEKENGTQKNNKGDE